MNQLVQPELDLNPGDHGSYLIGERNIVFRPETSQVEWESITRQLAEVNSHAAVAHVRTMFLLGDALNFGERNFGEEYASAIDATRKILRLQIKTIENAGWVASKVPPENRHDLLSMAHHAAVAKLDPSQQRELLDEAEREELNVKTLTAKVKEISPQRPKKLKPKTKEKGQEKKDEVTREKAIEAAATLAEFAAPYVAKKPSELTPEIRKAFDEHIGIVFRFARKFTRKENW